MKYIENVSCTKINTILFFNNISDWINDLFNVNLYVKIMGYINISVNFIKLTPVV